MAIDKNEKYLVFKREDIEEMLADTGDFANRSRQMLVTCLLKKSELAHPKYEYLIELLCESFSVNNKLHHYLSKALEYSSTETKEGIESVYVDPKNALILETLVMSKIFNLDELIKEVNLSLSVH